MQPQKKRNRLLKRKTANVIAGLIAMASLWCGTARAHRVTIFAWVDGNTVHTESKFSSGRGVTQGRIEVFDAEGDRLLEGQTDDRGAFSFAVPKRSALKIVLHAGAGHQSHWTIPLADIEAGGAFSDQGGDKGLPDMSASRPAQPLPQAASSNHPAKAVNHRSPDASLTESHIQAAVERALERRLNPLINRLNRMEKAREEPRWSDILGGIGYIIGLVGIAAWVRYRKQP
jgi:nickel transport protein